MDFDNLWEMIQQQAAAVAATQMVAKFQSQYYDALVTEGFSQEVAQQLLELTTRELIRGIATATPELFRVLGEMDKGKGGDDAS
jgi:hypothetical protein